MTKLNSTQINELCEFGRINSIPNFKIKFQAEDVLLIDDQFEIDSFSIRFHTSRFRKICFQNVVFHGEVRILYILDEELYLFSNCTFCKGVTLQNFGTSTIITGVSKFLDIVIFKGTFAKDRYCLINNLEIENDIFIEAEKESTILINNVNTNSKEKKAGICVTGYCSSLSIENVFVKSILLGSNISGSSSTFFDDVQIENVEAFKLIVHRAKIEKIFRIKDSEIHDIAIYSLLAESNKLEIRGNSKIGKCAIALGTLKTISILFDCSFEELRFTGIIQNYQELKIDGCIISKSIKFNEVDNRGIIDINQLVFAKAVKLSIIRSNLGVTNFLNCDFKNATFEFGNSKMTSVFLVNTIFPDKVSRNDKVDYQQAQLVFGELHTACKNQGDTVGEIMYQSLEMEAHFKTIGWSPRDFLTKFNLWLNKWSNNFGRYWGRGILFTLVIGISGFFFVVISSKEYSFGTHFYIEDRFASAFFKFMNPIRFFELDSLFSVNGNKPFLTLGFGSYIIDFVARIFLFYGYYQTVQAFRKFGRR